MIDLALAASGLNLPIPTIPDESTFLLAWDDDIRRCARSAANGDRAYAADLAQQARTRLLIANRAMPNAPTAYVRTVIANTVRSALHREARSFSARAPMAQELSEDLEAPAEVLDGRYTAAVAAWATRLPARLKAVYEYLYAEERSQREAAGLMKVSQPRVAQLHRQLLERGRVDLAHLAA